MSAPFVVTSQDGKWGLWMRPPHFRFVGWFDTYLDAISHAEQKWPHRL